MYILHTEDMNKQIMKQVDKDYGYILLAMAITRQAAKDYQREYRKSLAKGQTTDELITLQRWFRSPYGRLITFNKGEEIMESIHNNKKVIEKDEWFERWLYE